MNNTQLDHAYNTVTQLMRDMAVDPAWTIDISERPGPYMVDQIRDAGDAQLLLIAWLAHLGHLYATGRMLAAKDDDLDNDRRKQVLDLVEQRMETLGLSSREVAQRETPPSHQLRARVEAALVRGETQTSLSIASGVTRSKISDWLAGKCTMTLGTADRLWAACGGRAG